MSIQKDFWYKIEDSLYDEEEEACSDSSKPFKRKVCNIYKLNVMNEIEKEKEKEYVQLEFEFDEDLVAPI